MSDIDADPDRSRGRSITAVLLAVVFLAVIGASVGFILGQGKGDGNQRAAGAPTPAPTTTPAGTRSADPTVGPTAGTGGGTRSRSPTTARTFRPTTGDRCPQQTEEAAGGELSLKRYIRTRSAEVWICEGRGRLHYQGHLRGRPFSGATTESSLYLTDVRYEAGIYAATNGGTVYYVSVLSLKREEHGVEKSNEPVEEHYGD